MPWIYLFFTRVGKMLKTWFLLYLGKFNFNLMDLNLTLDFNVLIYLIIMHIIIISN